ncbi:MAG: hypothetical protein OXF23_06460 [Candidatus Dadabacteria bacterium]|nr:hypothetical protein [Candidatus Dadabacteria bacterium]
MSSIFDGLENEADILKILRTIEEKYPNPGSKSCKLWKLRQEPEIAGGNPSLETLLEKAVAMLAHNKHMPGCYNQIPVASGIVGKNSDRRTCVDLAHWDENMDCLRLIELKWRDPKDPNKDPKRVASAVRQILRYGAAYLFCRKHKKELSIQSRSAILAKKVKLEVVAPRSFYICPGSDAFMETKKNWSIARKSLESEAMIEELKSLELTMTLHARAFPDDFKLPFKSGDELRRYCDTRELTKKGEEIIHAFKNLKLVFSDSETVIK